MLIGWGVIEEGEVTAIRATTTREAEGTMASMTTEDIAQRFHCLPKHADKNVSQRATDTFKQLRPYMRFFALPYCFSPMRHRERFNHTKIWLLA